MTPLLILTRQTQLRGPNLSRERALLLLDGCVASSCDSFTYFSELYHPVPTYSFEVLAPHVKVLGDGTFGRY